MCCDSVLHQSTRMHVRSALEPVISGEIMELHHAKHHQAYVNGFNAAYERYREVRPAAHNADACMRRLHTCSGASFMCMHTVAMLQERKRG